MQKAVITGATGAVGMALIAELLKNELEVVAIVRPDSQRKDRLPSHERLKVLECKIQDMKCITKEQMGNMDMFFHLAWDGTVGKERDNLYLQLENVRYTLDAVCLAGKLGCKVFVGAGSQAECGRVEDMITSHTPANSETGYGIAKFSASQMSRLECRKQGIKCVWTRILSVYGPYDGESTMIISAIRKLLRGEKPSFSKGEQLWDYLYSQDAAKALYLLALNGRDGGVYPIGSGQVKPLYQYIEALRDAIDCNLEVGIGDLSYHEQQVMYLRADISELTRDTGFLPNITFAEGIQKTVEWCKKSEG